MRVLVFTSLYPNNVWPNHGVFIKERMVRFAKLKLGDVKVIAPVPYHPPIGVGWRSSYSKVAHRESRDGIEVIHPRYLMAPKIGMTLYGVMMFLSVYRTVVEVAKTFDFDLIDAHYLYPDGVAAVLLGRALSRPVVVSARGSDVNRFAALPVIRRWLQFTLRRADEAIAVSGALKEAMVSLGIPGEKISVIPNGVDAEKFYPIPKEAARRRLGLPPGKMIISVGGLIPGKGFELLIRAVKALGDESGEKEIGLTIVGDGPYREELSRLVASLGVTDRVRLVGAIPHQELCLWYSAADLFCLASAREGWPNVLLEALACGTPVVATRIGGIPEIISSEKVGILVNSTVSEIGEGIRRGLNTAWDAEELAGYARKHTWDEAARSVRGLFERVLERRSLGQKVAERRGSRQ